MWFRREASATACGKRSSETRFLYEEYRLRLEDVRDSIDQIEKYSSRGRQAFDDNELIRVWILHHLGIIGEACRGLSEAFRLSHPDEIWANAVGLRNVLVHQYFGIDNEAVWAVVERDLPVLKQRVLDAFKG
jgi:uncharacterized protein with HEPN domain